MAVLQKEYLFATDQYKEPAKVEGKQAIGILLVRLMIMDPGNDPLHPTMGVGIAKYRYATQEKLEALKNRITNQIETFLPEFQNSEVRFEVTPDKLLNIEIEINDVIYVYESATAPMPITIADITNN